ncbi:MAG: hypothetical protein IKR18_01405 [Bacteroidaceae bacterium]|nr:hypothetical protein [Bacteroidaceae bacterium]
MKHLLTMLLCIIPLLGTSAQEECSCGNGEKHKVELGLDLSAVGSLRVNDESMHGLQLGAQLFLTKPFGLCCTLGKISIRSNNVIADTWEVEGGVCLRTDWQNTMFKLQFGHSNKYYGYYGKSFYDLGMNVDPECLRLGAANIRLGLGVRLRCDELFKFNDLADGFLPYFSVGLAI